MKNKRERSEHKECKEHKERRERHPPSTIRQQLPVSLSLSFRCKFFILNSSFFISIDLHLTILAVETQAEAFTVRTYQEIRLTVR